MFNQKTQKLLAFVLALVMLFSAVPSVVFATGASGDSVIEFTSEKAQSPVLKNGSAIIPQGADITAVKAALFEALVENPEGIDPQTLEWEYYCEGKDKTGLTSNNAWGSIEGFESKKGPFKITCTHPALANNGDGNYQVRIKGTTAEVTLTKAAKLNSSITLNEGAQVSMPYNEDLSVNYDELRRSIFENAVASTNPVLTVDDVSIEYYATAKTGSVGGIGKEWMPLEGGTKDLLTYPAISVGEQRIRISYAGTDEIFGSSAETTVNIKERPSAQIVFKEGPYSAKLILNDDMQVDYENLRKAIFDAVVESSEPALTVNDISIEYYATAQTGAVGDIGKAWMPLEGGKKDVLTYPAIPAGEQKLRFVWGGNSTYAPFTHEFTLTVIDRDQLVFNLKDGKYEVGMVFSEDMGYDYKATAAAIYNAVVESTSPVSLTADDVRVEYNTDKTGTLDLFKPLNESDLTGLVKFGTGDWEIKISWDGNRDYRGNSVVVNVTTTDNRADSAIVYKEGASIVYNVDANVMKNDLLNNFIDWEKSSLPAKDTLTADDFTFEYYGENILPGDINGGVKQWAPIEGGTVNLLTYPRLGAGSDRQVRISFNGSADYRPSGFTQGNVNVNKAKVKVTVHSTNIFADEKLPENFVTTNPVDKFDKYVIFAGITSSVTTSLYLELPEKFTNSVVLSIIDPIVEKIFGKSFTQMLNDGITVGELREMLSTQELLDTLEKLNIDIGTIGQILKVVNGLPSIADSVRISFGTPNRAGLYTVFAITDNPNYETGFGMGMLLTKMRLSGSKLTWNSNIPGGKLTAEQAKTFDFGATLSYNGDVTVSQSNVRYLYSGFTSSWRIYSSTTTPPTEPGSYVVTVVTLGGNYLAAPITRTFRITK